MRKRFTRFRVNSELAASQEASLPALNPQIPIMRKCTHPAPAV
jgi:hypothetical protein